MNEMRKSIRDLRVWLNGLTQELTNFSREVVDYSRNFEPRDEEWKNLETMLNQASQLKSYIKSNSEGLEVLSKSPPGMVSGIVDFIFTITHGEHQWESEKYKEKLQKIDSSMTQMSLNQLDNVMKLSEGTHQQIALDLARKFAQDENAQDHLEAALMKTIEIVQREATSDEDTVPPQAMVNLSASIQQTVDNPQHFEQLKEALRKRLRGITPDQKQEWIRKMERNISYLQYPGQQNQQEQQASHRGRVVYAQAGVQDLQQWLQLFKDRYSEANKKITELAKQMQDIKDTDAAMRYYNYVKELLGEHNPNSVASLLNKLSKEVQKLLSVSPIDTQKETGETTTPSEEYQNQQDGGQDTEQEYQEERGDATASRYLYRKIYSFTRLGGSNVRDNKKGSK